LEVTVASRNVARSWSVEFEDVFGVYLDDALTKAMMVNDKRAIFLFIVRLQPRQLLATVQNVFKVASGERRT
jgi:hypothetical protein